MSAEHFPSSDSPVAPSGAVFLSYAREDTDAARRIADALRSQGIDTQLVIYPGQYHGIRKPSYLKDRLERHLAWYGKYLK